MDRGRVRVLFATFLAWMTAFFGITNIIHFLPLLWTPGLSLPIRWGDAFWVVVGHFWIAAWWWNQRKPSA